MYIRKSKRKKNTQKSVFHSIHCLKKIIEKKRTENNHFNIPSRLNFKHRSTT
jgi:hypothetical protein